MARIFSTKERIKLEVEERGTVTCETCKGQGQVQKPQKMRCPVCQGYKVVPGEEVISTVVYEISPLNWDQKQEILSQNRMVSGTLIEDDARRTFLCVKYGVKGVKGMKRFDPDRGEGGEEVDWEPKFDKTGNLENESVEELLNTSMTGALTQFVGGLTGGIPRFVINTATGLPMAGVRVEIPGESRKK